MMNFEEFGNSVAENIKGYLPEEYADAAVSLQEVIKNNDTRLTGLMVRRYDSIITPTIYLEGYFEQYENGREFSYIMRDIADARMENDAVQGMDTNRFMKFEQARDNIICKLINREMNEAYLADKPYTLIEDLAVVYAVNFDTEDAGRMNMPITYGIMETYGITKEELHDIAIRNLTESQVEFKTVRDILVDVLLQDGYSLDYLEASMMVPPEGETPDLYVLTNADRTNGAAMVLNSKIMEEISEKLKGDYIVLPSSIHEVLIHPFTEDMDRQEIENMIQDINSGYLEPEERLSDYAYYYDSKEHGLFRMDKLEERKKQREDNLSTSSLFDALSEDDEGWAMFLDALLREDQNRYCDLGDQYDSFYGVRSNPYSDKPENSYIFQEYIKQESGMAKIGDILYMGTQRECLDLLEKLETGELEPGNIKTVAAKKENVANGQAQEKTGGKSMSDMEFVTIDLSKKQVDYDSARRNEKNGKDYVRIFAPGGGVFFYPLESLKENKENNARIYFSRPVGTEITLYFSERNPDVPDDAPASEKYINSSRIVKIEDLKDMYKQEREAYAESQKQKYENSPFVNVTVPTAWGREFSGGSSEQKFVSISVPIKEGEQSNYYSFVLPAEAFKKSTKEEDMSYFGFPRKKRDSDENYTVTLKRGERQPDGTYKDIIKEISSEELAAAIKKAKEMQESKLELEVSEKLLRNFNSRDGKALVSLSVPVYDAEQQKDMFYNIVILESNTSDTEREGYKKVSISADYAYTAKRSVPDESADGGYKDMELKISGAEIKEAFAASKDRYAERKASEDLQTAHGHQEGTYRPHNRRGR